MQKLDQQSRLAFIDFILHWEGEIQIKTLTAQFSISRQQAWQDVRFYYLNSGTEDRYIYFRFQTEHTEV